MQQWWFGFAAGFATACMIVITLPVSVIERALDTLRRTLALNSKKNERSQDQDMRESAIHTKGNSNNSSKKWATGSIRNRKKARVQNGRRQNGRLHDDDDDDEEEEEEENQKEWNEVQELWMIRRQCGRVLSLAQEGKCPH